MKDKATKRFQKCQFPFKFKDKTHNGCIDFIDIRNGKKVPGKPWCSTKVRGSDRKHVEGGGHYGNCDSSCPNANKEGPTTLTGTGSGGKTGKYLSNYWLKKKKKLEILYSTA